MKLRNKSNPKLSTDLKTQKDQFINSSILCLSNANRLISNAELLDCDIDTIPTSYALAFLAQEETAKAFLLYLIYSDALPWNQYIRKSLKDHTCKQLWFIVLDALNPDNDEFLAKLKEPSSFGIGAFMTKVGDMLNWYRYAKINTWEQGYCSWDENPFDEDVKEIIKGKWDKRKQDALYVKIGKRGEVISIPASVKKRDASRAIETAKRFSGFVSDLIENNMMKNDDVCINWLKQVLKYIFTPAIKTGREITNAIPGVIFYEIRQPIVQVSKNKKPDVKGAIR